MSINIPAGTQDPSAVILTGFTFLTRLNENEWFKLLIGIRVHTYIYSSGNDKYI